MAARQLASHNDYVKLEALVESGMSVYQAAQQIGLPLGAFKSRNADREWYEQITERSKTVRAAKVDERTDEIVARPDPPQAIFTAWQKANHPDYRDKQQIEISGTVQHEAKVVVLADILAAAGQSQGFESELGDRSRAALSGAADLLPAPAEPEASPVPARRES